LQWFVVVRLLCFCAIKKKGSIRSSLHINVCWYWYWYWLACSLKLLLQMDATATMLKLMFGRKLWFHISGLVCWQSSFDFRFSSTVCLICLFCLHLWMIISYILVTSYLSLKVLPYTSSLHITSTIYLSYLLRYSQSIRCTVF